MALYTVEREKPDDEITSDILHLPLL